MASNTKKMQLVDRLKNYARTVREHVTPSREAAVMSAATGMVVASSGAVEAAIRYSGPLTGTTQWALLDYPAPVNYLFGGGDYDGDVRVAITDTAGSTMANFYLSAYAGFNNFQRLGFGTGDLPGSGNTLYGPGPSGEGVLGQFGLNGNLAPDRLAQGESIGPAQSNFFISPAIKDGLNNNARLVGVGPNAIYNNGNWDPYGYGVDLGYLGVRFDTSGGQDSHYGWVRLEINFMQPASFAIQARIVDWAYETTPNTAILAGDTGLAPATASASAAGINTAPEPGGMALAALGLLALGARGMRAHRSHQTANQD